MPRESTNTVACNDLAIKKLVKAQIGEPRKEWRLVSTKSGVTVPGFVLRTQPSGGAAYYLVYHNELGKKRTFKLADYGTVTLASAIEKAKKVADLVANGEDPAADKAANREAMTFKDLAEKFLDEGGLAPMTKDRYATALKADVYKPIGDKPIDKVTEDDVVAICRKIAKRGAKVQADKTKAYIGGAYSFGRQQGFTKHNPTRDVAKFAPEKSVRDRTPESDELKKIWEGLDAGLGSVSKPMQRIIKLTILTGQRRSEVAGARISELDLNGDSPMWIIPGDSVKRGKTAKIIKGRTKNKRTQRVSLSPYAAQLFREAIADAKELKGITKEMRECVFPADMGRVATGKAPRTPYINGESVSKAMRRLRNEVGIEDITPHDMRRGISSFLKDNDFSKDVRDLVLNHKDSSVTGEHYESTARMEKQVRSAFAAWESHVLKAVGVESASGDNVVSLRA